MRIVFRSLNFLTGLLLVISTAFQLLAMFNGVIFNELNTFTKDMPWLVPVWSAALVLLVVAYVLLLVLGKKSPWQIVVIACALVGAVAAFAVALALRDALPDYTNVNGELVGLTTWRMVYRHMSSSVAGLLMILTASLRLAVYRIEQRKTLNSFDPTDSTIGLDSFGGDGSAYKPKRAKRSVRRKQEKELSGTEKKATYRRLIEMTRSR